MELSEAQHLAILRTLELDEDEDGFSDIAGWKGLTYAQKRFLLAYVQEGTARGACRTGRVGRANFRRWIASNPTFVSVWNVVLEMAVDDLEDVASERGREKSDTLLIYLMNVKRYVKPNSDGSQEKTKRVILERVCPSCEDDDESAAAAASEDDG